MNTANKPAHTTAGSAQIRFRASHPAAYGLDVRQKMFSLRNGLSFEDSGSLLRWGIDVDAAWKVPGAAHYNLPDDRHRIRWDATTLSGLRCGVLAYLPDGAFLDSLTLWIIPRPRVYRGDDALLHYLTTFDHLTGILGPPSITPTNGNLYGPILTWRHDDCFLQMYVGERMGDYCTLEITRGRSPRFKEVEQASAGNP